MSAPSTIPAAGRTCQGCGSMVEASSRFRNGAGLVGLDGRVDASSPTSERNEGRRDPRRPVLPRFLRYERRRGSHTGEKSASSGPGRSGRAQNVRNSASRALWSHVAWSSTPDAADGSALRATASRVRVTAWHGIGWAGSRFGEEGPSRGSADARSPRTLLSGRVASRSGGSGDGTSGSAPADTRWGSSPPTVLRHRPEARRCDARARRLLDDRRGVCITA